MQTKEICLTQAVSVDVCHFCCLHYGMCLVRTNLIIHAYALFVGNYSSSSKHILSLSLCLLSAVIFTFLYQVTNSLIRVFLPIFAFLRLLKTEHCKNLISFLLHFGKRRTKVVIISFKQIPQRFWLFVIRIK